MAQRKSKKRKQAKRRSFKVAHCTKCGLCNGSFTPDFCYDLLFNKDPKVFTSHVLDNLIMHRHFVLQILEKSYEEVKNCGLSLSIFRQIFCTSHICDCTTSGERIQQCLCMFKQQAESNTSNGTIKKIFPKYGKKKISVAGPAPKVSVFMSENAVFKAEVKRILENNFEQPDKDRESS